MILGTGLDAVNAITFGVNLGQRQTDFPYADRVKLLTMVDGTEEWVNFGARVERIAELVLGDMTKASWLVLIAYLTANKGNVIKLTHSFAAENPWVQTTLLSTLVCYANVIDFEDLGEADFSVSDSLYSVRLVLAYAGTGASSRPNATDSSLLDICVEIDTIRATSNPANAAALAALTGMIGGQRYLQVDTRAVYIFDPSGTTFIDFNDGAGQLSGYWRLVGIIKGTNTDADGKLYLSILDDGGGYRHINFYMDAGKTLLVAHTATYNSIGRKSLVTDNSSGVGGSIMVDVVGAADTDIQLGMWRFLYTLVADNSAYGLVSGVFYLSAFADISSGSAGAQSKTWKSGLINKDSVDFPNAQIDISQGPGIERLEGFAFSMNNVAKFWTFVVDNRVIFHGAKVKLKIYDRTNTTMVTIRTGINHTNSFDYLSYRFKIEPTIMSENKAFPETYLDATTYPYSDNSIRGKPVISTYGRWEAGALQVANFTLKPQRFSDGRRFLGFNAWNAGTLELRVDIDYDYFTTLLGTTDTYPGDEPVRYLFLQITEQSGQPDVGKMKRVTAITDVSANVTGLTLVEAFTNVPASGARFQIYMSSVLLLADDEAMIGFGAPGYLVDSPTGAVTVGKEMFAQLNGAIVSVPDGLYQEVGADKNALTININTLEADESGKIIAKGMEQMQRLNIGLAGILFASTTSCVHNFEFAPQGIYTTYKKALFNRPGFLLAGMMVASYDRITIAWTPETSTAFTTQRIRRYIPDLQVFDSTFSKTIGDITTSYYVDSGADGALVANRTYQYMVDAVRADSTIQQIAFIYDVIPGAGKTITRASRVNSELIAMGGSGLTEVTLIWNRLSNQTQIQIYRNDIVSGDVLIATIASTTQTYYVLATGAVNGLDEGYRIRVSTSAIGDNSKTWFKPDGLVGDDKANFFQLVTSGGPYTSPTYASSAAWGNGSPGSLLESHGYITRTYIADNAAGLPAAAVVMTWPLRIDRTRLPNMSNATEVRLLGDFVVGSWTGVDTSPSDISLLIQLRGVRRDHSSILLAQYTNADAGLETTQLAYGSYAKFVNLPTSKGGADSNYSTEQQASGGIYTGKDMWKLPDWLFVDDAFEWNKLEYLMFCVTNAEAIPTAAASTSRGYRLGFGGLPDHAQAFTNVNKTTFFLEYIRKFEGGLTAPQFARIDGGMLDDASGTITGSASSLIEKVRDISASVLYKVLGFTPKYAGTEMASRRLWMGHFQQTESRDLQSLLALLAKNNWGCYTVASDDTLYLRTLDVDEPNVAVVFAFTGANIIKGSISQVQFRKQSEIYQKFRAKYNFDPRVSFNKAEQESDRQRVDNPSFTEEMLVGWDMVLGKKLSGGFQETVETSGEDGTISYGAGAENALAEYCRQSLLLYATGGQTNELGSEKNELFEMFYRPAKVLDSSGVTVEKTLPNQITLYGNFTLTPKRSMQALFDKLVRFHVFDAWTFSFDVNIKNVVYNVTIAGLLDEAETAERKLKLLDKVTVNLPFQSNSVTMDCLITGIKINPYAGTARLTVFALRPPGQRNTIIDPIWDAGYGPRVNTQYYFKDESYGLSPPPNLGTFADAGNGARTNTDYDFPDGSFADSDGEGTGQI